MSQSDKETGDLPEDDDDEKAEAEEKNNLTDNGGKTPMAAASETKETGEEEDNADDTGTGTGGQPTDAPTINEVEGETGEFYDTGNTGETINNEELQLSALIEEDPAKLEQNETVTDGVSPGADEQTDAEYGPDRGADEQEGYEEQVDAEEEKKRLEEEAERGAEKKREIEVKVRRMEEAKMVATAEQADSSAIGESAGMHSVRNEEVLEADSDLAKAFAEQIGLYDEDEFVQYDDEEEEEEEWEEEGVIRDANLLVSGPMLTKDSILPQNLLEFRYSYGFDCAKPYNMCVLDPDTIVFTAGTMLLFFKVSTGTVTFRRSSSGQGIGHIAKHPHLPHFAVGEKGKEPYIIIFEWPSLSLVALLRHGTRKSYSHLDYSPTGELLCSQGGSPDYLFTVWNWKKEKIMLRTRSSNTDVLNSRFSNYMPGHIATGGMGHIKFWKMCKTFTGLKLKGETGRFGKTEISDIMGLYGMPDEKVVSGCDWGNILVWETGIIKFQVTRKNRQKCHEGAITQFEFQNGELITAGKDGFVKSWYYETIDMADPPDDDRFVEVEPMFELEVADHLGPASILSMARVNPTVKGDTSWYAQIKSTSILCVGRTESALFRGLMENVPQDANGGIWQLNLAMTSSAVPPKRLYACHAGHIVGLDTSPISDHFASLDTLGRLHLWDLKTSRLLAIKVMAFPGSSLLWLPEDVAPCGCVLLAGLSDGGLRAYAVNVAAASQSGKSPILDSTSGDAFTLIQFIKPHTAPIMCMDISVTHKHIATISLDLTAFVFGVETAGLFCKIKPIGFIRIPSAPTYLRWKAFYTTTFYVGCEKGEVLEAEVPENPTHNTDVSFEYTEAKVRTVQTKSIKSQILRDIYLKEQQERKDARLEEKKEQLETLKKENPGLEIDEEVFLADSEAEEELPPLYIPEKPSSVVIVIPIRNDPDSVWTILSGYDCGYLYRYRFGKEEPEEWHLYFRSGMDEICVGRANANRTLMFSGQANGKLVVGAVQRNDAGPTTDHWSLGMHDGRLHLLQLSRDEKYVITAGEDLNIFTYSLNVPDEWRTTPKPTVALVPFATPTAVNDAYTLDEPALEHASGKKENDRRMKEALGKKQQVEHTLFNFAEQFNRLKRRNRALPKSQVIPKEELELDPRITENLQKSIAEEADNVKRRYEYQLEKARLRHKKLDEFFTQKQTYDTLIVRGIRKNVSVRTIRHTVRGELFELAKFALEYKLKEDAKKNREVLFESVNDCDRGIDMNLDVEEADIYVPAAPTPVESFLRGISAFEHRFSSRLKRLLEKYQSRAAKKERRKMEWASFMAKMPDVNQNDPEDEARIAEAERTIGDYKLKSGSKYKVPKHLIATTVSKCQELLDTRVELDNAVYAFNESVKDLYQRKSDLIQKLHSQLAELKRIHEELKPNLHKPLPHVPSLSDEKDSNKTHHLRFRNSAVEEERDKASPKKKAAELGKAPVTSEHYYVKDPAAEDIFAFGPQLAYPEHFKAKSADCEDVSGEIPDMHLMDTSTDVRTLINLSLRDNVTTPFEKELRLKRVLRRTWEQDTIIKQMAQSIAEFDEEIEKMTERRLIAQRDSTLIRLRLNTLTHELNIIKACEAREDYLMGRVTEKQLEKKAMMQQIVNIQSRLESRSKGILRCQDKQKHTFSAFFEAVGDNTFKDYLRRIFKKKYKPPKTDDESSSESSSTTSSEEEDDVDAASVDSKEIQAVRFDENVCPQGCPRELYDLTFTLRAERHEAEREIAEHQRVSETLKREQDSCNKKLRIIEDGLQANQDDLELFQREKQHRLNEVDATVVIRLSQMKHVKPDGTFIPMKDTLVFDTTMLTYLGKRVGQLNIEANEERERHRKNRRHLYRMVQDVRYMENRLKKMKEEINEAQYNKFGQLVKLEDLEAALLKRYIYEMRLSVDEIKKDFQELIKSIKDTVRERYNVLIETVENNTDLQNLLLALTEERNKLFLRKEASKAAVTHSTAATISEQEFQEDIAKLRELSKKMSDKRSELLQELIRLRQKGTAPASPSMQSSGENELGPGPPGYHACCVPAPAKPPPWPPRVIPGFDKLRYCGVLQAREKPPTPPESNIVSMWERLLQDMGMEGQTFWPDHSDPINKYNLSMETIGEGFVFQTLHDLPSVHEEDVLASHFGRDASAPLFAVVGDRVHVVGQSEEDTDVPDEATEMDEDDIDKLESTTELFTRVPSTAIEGAVGDLIDRLSASTEKSVSRKVSTKTIDKARSLDGTDSQRKQSRSSSQTRQSRSSSQTRQSRSSSQTRQSRSSSQTRHSRSNSQTRRNRSASKTEQSQSNSETQTQSGKQPQGGHNKRQGEDNQTQADESKQ